jgi:hypothetical protein
VLRLRGYRTDVVLALHSIHDSHGTKLPISRPTRSFSEKAVYSCRLCFGVFALSVEIRLSAAGGTCVS